MLLLTEEQIDKLVNAEGEDVIENIRNICTSTLGLGMNIIYKGTDSQNEIRDNDELEEFIESIYDKYSS